MRRLNDPFSVARRHWGWMLQINAWISPLAANRRWKREFEKGGEKRRGVIENGDCSLQKGQPLFS
jgi:hypothetical protein